VVGTQREGARGARQHGFRAAAGDEAAAFAGTSRLWTGATAHAGRLAEKLRRRIAEIEFEEVGQVTISIGVAEARPGDTTKSWFRRADEWMYQAKRAGRNRVIVEGSEFRDPDAPNAGD